MTMVLDESVPITYNWNEPVSPTAGGPNLAISPVPPSEDDSAAEDLRSTSQLREHREAKLISPKTAYAGDSRWSGVGEHLFTSRIAEDFPTPPDALLGLEQIDKTSEDISLESLQTALQNVFDILKRHYNTHPMSAYVSPYVSSTWNEGGKHHVWFEVRRIAERFSGAFPVALFGLEQSNDEAREEGLPAPLANALRDLHELIAEAHEEEIAPPSESAMADADSLIRAIYDIRPRQYLVELLPEGVIAITIPGGFRCSVMLLCESEGGALCSVNINGKHRRKRYLRTDQLLPDSFLREALRELERE